MDEIIHVGAAPDGAILEFPFSACYFMKVCSPYTGVGGVVELFHGAYFTYADLEKRGLGQYCKVLYKNLNALYYEDEE
jgi:hypothetical protein